MQAYAAQDALNHITNRGNARAEVFHKPDDYAAFIDLFAPACERISMRCSAGA
jgi:hypothetical protein